VGKPSLKIISGKKDSRGTSPSDLGFETILMRGLLGVCFQSSFLTFDKKGKGIVAIGLT
jgi:hypothetical protein